MSKQRSASNFEFGIFIIRICSEFSLPTLSADRQAQAGILNLEIISHEGSLGTPFLFSRGGKG
jgi:hypothetical protein